MKELLTLLYVITIVCYYYYILLLLYVITISSSWLNQLYNYITLEMKQSWVFINNYTLSFAVQYPHIVRHVAIKYDYKGKPAWGLSITLDINYANHEGIIERCPLFKSQNWWDSYFENNLPDERSCKTLGIESFYYTICSLWLHNPE